ncbi:hypothetical protein EIK77_002873 [Talaromyces pinophilus]|nr:hypothetical protein EIK77_002873 [Talaromyces pinophilus]
MSQSVTESDTEPITDFDGEYDSDSDTLKCIWEHSLSTVTPKSRLTNSSLKL